MEKKWPCDFPAKGKWEKEGWNHLPPEERETGSPPQKPWKGFYLPQQGVLEELGSISAPAPEGEVDPRDTELQIPENSQGKNFSTLFKVL